MILNLTSDSMTTAQMYDAASTIIQQKLVADAGGSARWTSAAAPTPRCGWS